MSSDHDLWGSDDPEYIDALLNVSLSQSQAAPQHIKRKRSPTQDGCDIADSNPDVTPSLIPNRNTTYADSSNHKSEKYIYGAAKFAGFGEYMFRKRAKLQIQNRQLTEGETAADKPRGIFHGVAIYVNGFTDPPFQELREMIMAHGGVFHAYLDRKSMVTHVIASQLTPAKVLEYQRGKMKVVTPEWIVRSIAAGVKLPWQEFTLKPGTSAVAALGRGSAFAATGNTDVDQAQSTSRVPQRTLLESVSQQRAAMTGTHFEPTTPLSLKGRQSTETQSTVNNMTQSTSALQDRTTMPSNPLPLITTTSPTPLRTAGRTIPVPNSPGVQDGAVSPQKPSYALYDSNPMAAKLMESTQWRKVHTAANAAAFTESYFQNSRLHHLSTWKSELKKLVAEARQRSDDAASSQPLDVGSVSMRGVQLPQFHRKSKGSHLSEKVFMHCDFDSFFVAAGLVGRPHLKGRPVVVCHSGGGKSSTSELASASYEARAFGIKNGMSLGQARQLCPEVQTIPYEFERYKTFSLKFYTTLMSFADDLQAVSVDEALIDVSDRVSCMESAANEGGEAETHDFALELAEQIRDKVREETGCEISIGVSHNIMLARMATRHAKPAGSFHLLRKDVDEHVASLSIRAVHGVGRSIQDKIVDSLGVNTLGELRAKPKETLQKLLGEKTGDKLWKAARGIDDTPLESDKPRKSVSAEVNYGIRFEDETQAKAFIQTLAAEVGKRLREVGRRGKSLTLKVMVRSPDAPKEAAKFLGHGMVDCYNKSTSIADHRGGYTDDSDIIAQECWKLLQSFRFDPKELRGLGIQIQKLDDEAGAKAPEPPSGQSRLQFSKLEKGKGKAILSETNVIDVDDISEMPRGDIPDGKGDVFGLPSASQLDHSVLEALPEDIRCEVLSKVTSGGAGPGPSTSVSRSKPSHANDDGDHPVTEHSRSYSLPPVPSSSQPEIQFLPPPKVSKASSVSPTKSKGPRVDVRHITKQLAPKRMIPIAPPTKLSIFSSTRPLVEASELKKLGIDPLVFGQLPKDIQKEQLAALRQEASSRARSTSLRPSDAGSGAGSRSRSPSMGAGARPKPAPIPLASYTTLPEIKKLSKLEDVQEMIQDWIKYRRREGPIPAEVERVSTYLVKCAATDIGLEVATGILRFWRQALRDRWPAEEGCSDVFDVDGSAAGQAWWSAFNRTRSKVDQVVKARFGGKLGLGRY